MPDSVNVLFKKGLLSDLFTETGSVKSTVTVVDGALYFALNKLDSSTDNERGKLYLGEDGKLIPIGEDVVLRTVANINSLPTASLHKGEFYYSEQGNILAYSNGSAWAQINSAARLVGTSSALTISGSSNSAVIDMAVSDRIGSDNNTMISATGEIALAGGSNVTVSTSGQTITVSAKDTTYDLAAASAGTATQGGRSLGANITLTDNNSPAGVDTVTIRSTDSVIARMNANNEIELVVDTSGVGSVIGMVGGVGQVESDGSATSGTASTEGFHMNVSSTTATFGANIDPQISIKNASGATASTIHFVNGTAALDVYSTSAVEERITSVLNAVNAMTYRGSAETMSAITGVSGGLHNGDVFVATGDFNIENTYTTDNGRTVEQGYLVVVHGGTETNGVIADPTSATYTVIKANDTDTTYSVSGITNGLQFNEGSEAIGSLTLSAGTAIDVSDSGSAAKVITVSHGAVTSTVSTATTASTVSYTGTTSVTGTFNTVTGVTVNGQGHVTRVDITPIKINDTVLATGSTTVTAASNTATISLVLQDSSGNEAGNTFSLTSSSLEITSSGTAISANLVWGSF